MEELKATPGKANSMNESLSQILKPYAINCRAGELLHLKSTSTKHQTTTITNCTVALLKSPRVGLP
jgi:hypothetical protein